MLSRTMASVGHGSIDGDKLPLHCGGAQIIHSNQFHNPKSEDFGNTVPKHSFQRPDWLPNLDCVVDGQCGSVQSSVSKAR